MRTDIDTEAIYNAIIEQYDEEKHKGDDTWYYDIKSEEIDDYCLKYDYEAKEVVDEYGVFDAIKLYQDDNGEFDIEDNNRRNYLKLFYLIVDEAVMKEYGEKLEKYNSEKEEIYFDCIDSIDAINIS